MLTVHGQHAVSYIRVCDRMVTMTGGWHLQTDMERGALLVAT